MWVRLYPYFSCVERVHNWDPNNPPNIPCGEFLNESALLHTILRIDEMMADSFSLCLALAVISKLAPTNVSVICLFVCDVTFVLYPPTHPSQEKMKKSFQKFGWIFISSALLQFSLARPYDEFPPQRSRTVWCYSMVPRCIARERKHHRCTGKVTVSYSTFEVNSSLYVPNLNSITVSISDSSEIWPK